MKWFPSSNHMSSSKTALRSSETCLILAFSTTRSSSTFDVTFEEVCDENGGKSDGEKDEHSDRDWSWTSPPPGPLPPFEGVRDGESDLLFRHHYVLLHTLWYLWLYERGDRSDQEVLLHIVDTLWSVTRLRFVFSLHYWHLAAMTVIILAAS